MSDLPPGPGLRLRWLAAVPLVLVSTVLPVFEQLALGAMPFDVVLDAEGPTFWERFWRDADNYWSVLVLQGVVTLVFLVRRTMFAVWPAVCLWLPMGALAPVLLSGRSGDLLPNLGCGAGLVLLNFGLGTLTVWVLSRPVARDVALSKLEIPYRVPGSRARLRVKHDRLVLDRLRSSDRNTSRTIRWTELRAARLEELAEPTSWRAGPKTWIKVPAGPALHVTSTNEEWRLPVTESLGADLAAAITLRSHNRT